MRSRGGINQSEFVDRPRRVAEVIHRELADLIPNEFDDPRLNLVTITDVRITRDLRSARVFVSRSDCIVSSSNLAPEKNQGKTETRTIKDKPDNKSDKRSTEEDRDYVVALNRASARIRRLLARRLTTKLTPKLLFVFDEALERGHRISSLLDTSRSMDRVDRVDKIIK